MYSNEHMTDAKQADAQRRLANAFIRKRAEERAKQPKYFQLTHLEPAARDIAKAQAVFDMMHEGRGRDAFEDIELNSQKVDYKAAIKAANDLIAANDTEFNLFLQNILVQHHDRPANDAVLKAVQWANKAEVWENDMRGTDPKNKLALAKRIYAGDLDHINDKLTRLSVEVPPENRRLFTTQRTRFINSTGRVRNALKEVEQKATHDGDTTYRNAMHEAEQHASNVAPAAAHAPAPVHHHVVAPAAPPLPSPFASSMAVPSASVGGAKGGFRSAATPTTEIDTPEDISNLITTYHVPLNLTTRYLEGSSGFVAAGQGEDWRQEWWLWSQGRDASYIREMHRKLYDASYAVDERFFEQGNTNITLDETFGPGRVKSDQLEDMYRRYGKELFPMFGKS